MKFKSEFANAVKLFILLFLLFWSFTWNSDTDHIFTHANIDKKESSNFPKDASYVRSSTLVFVNQHSVLIESFSKVRYGFKKSSKTISRNKIIIPPFNEWKEQERIKYEKDSSKEINVQHHKKVGQRKLNYASSKCGAKVLASNSGVRRRMAILNEKPDEYMLNPCKVKTWFVIELCDTVEATQIELANYELYSSTPKEFSVFWSEIFPTSGWHLLGTFEAKDQRTMQTFDLKLKNLGKFIKVIIYSHHGEEHFCPLSVIRVLGYSMVENFENNEKTEESNIATLSDNRSGTKFDRNSTSENKQILKQNLTHESKDISVRYSNEFSLKICALYFLHCAYVHPTNAGKLCPNQPTCRFLMEVLQKSSINCNNIFCSTIDTMCSVAPNTAQAGKTRENKNQANHYFPLNVKFKHENSKKGTISNRDDSLEDYKNENSLDQGTNNAGLNKTEEREERDDSNVTENFLISNSSRKQEKYLTAHKRLKHLDTDYVQEKCICEKESIREKVINVNEGDSSSKEFEQDFSNIEKDVESAGLIQKESVFVKLTSRIRTSEMDLILINKYLQQLSQSYRQQMEEMQMMINQTVKTIDVASEKAMIIDKKQQESINTLQQKMASLTHKVDYLMNGHRDLIKRVFEMHAFFLVLEFIIISTIFTIFLNIFSRRNSSVKYRMLKYNF